MVVAFLRASTDVWFFLLKVAFRIHGFLVVHMARDGLPCGSVEKSLLTMRETLLQSLHQGAPLEENMAAHSSILPGDSHGQRGLAGTVHKVAKSGTR